MKWEELRDAMEAPREKFKISKKDVGDVLSPIVNDLKEIAKENGAVIIMVSVLIYLWKNISKK